MIGQRDGLIRLISDPWAYLTQMSLKWNRGLVDRKARAGVGHSIQFRFASLSNPIFESGWILRFLIPVVKRKKREKGHSPTSSPRFRPERNCKWKKNLCALSMEWSDSSESPLLYLPLFFCLRLLPAGNAWPNIGFVWKQYNQGGVHSIKAFMP